MLKKIGIIILLGVTLFSCNRRYERAMKSSDKNYVLSVADQLFEEKKYPLAIELYGRIGTQFTGTEQAPNIMYNSASANYEDKNFRLAAHQFKNFSVTYPVDSRAEDALYKSAYAFYLDSPEYDLDQKSTYSAIDELQNFINNYPESFHLAKANEMIDELRDKLELKALNIAKIYFKTMKYKAAAIAFDNMLNDFPDTKYREEAFWYSLRSKHQLAVNFSRLEHKESRIQEANTQYRLLVKYYPNTEYKSDADKIVKQLDTDLEKSRISLAKIEAEKNKNK